MSEVVAPIVEVVANPLRHPLEPVPDAGPNGRPRGTGPGVGGPSDPTAGPTAFHRRLPGYAPTPLIDAAALATELGVGRLLVKDESSRLGLPAFKMLGASWASYRALAAALEQLTGAAMPEWATLDDLAVLLAPLQPLDLATATDGNHGRAVARFAHLFGLGARIDAIVSEGATCEVVAGGTYEDAVARAGQEAGDDCLVVSDTSWEGYVTVPGWVIEGYTTIFAEIDAQLAAAGLPAPDAVMVQSGVGALAGAVAARYRRDPDDPTLFVCVEPTTADCLMESIRAGEEVEVPGPHHSIMAGLNCGRPSPVAFGAVSAGFDLFCAIDDDDAVNGMLTLADAGVVSGETGGAGLGALLAMGGAGGLSLAEGSSVLVMSTEGATDPAFFQRTVGRSPDQITADRPPCVAAGTCPVPRCNGNCAAPDVTP